MWQWEHQYAPFAESRRVIILDLLGSGFSDKPDIAYSPQVLVEFFVEFLDALQVNEATLVGNSMGAGLAMAVSLSRPERINALVLISGFPPTLEPHLTSPQYKRFLQRRPPLWLAAFGNWLSGRWATETILKEIVYNEDLLTPIVIERSFHNRKQSDFLRPLYSLIDHIEQWETQYGPRIQDVRKPTLILWGANDRIFAPAVGEMIHRMIPHSRFHQIPKAGHIPQWEQPDRVNALIKDFLDHLPQ